MKGTRGAAWILILLTLFSLTGCRGKGGPTADGSGRQEHAGGIENVVTAEDGTRWLTNVFKSYVMEIPDGWEFSGSGGIEYNAERDEFRGILIRMAEDKSNAVNRYFDREIVVWDGQGNRRAEIPLHDPEYRWRAMGQSCFFGDLLYSLLWEYDGTAFLGVWDAASGSLLREMPALEIEGWDPLLYVREIAADGEGNLYVSNGNVVTILSPEFALVNVFKARTFDMARTPEGEIWAVCPDMAGRGLFRVNRETGLEKLTYLDADAGQLSFAPAEDGSGWSILAAIGSGINRFTPSDEGKWPSEERMSFASSGVSYTSEPEGKADSERMAAAVTEDRFVFISSERKPDGEYVILPRIYEKAPDIDLTTIRTVTLAHAEPLPDYVRFQIVRYNRDHDDIRVTALDYSSYTSGINPMGGPFRLATDILNGLVHPDAVFGSLLFDPVKTLMSKGVTVDLGAYLDADPEVNRETVAGCVLRTFDDGAGGVWGISPFFRLRSVVGRESVLGQYADGWDLGGFLDFADSLPEGAILSLSACAEGNGEVEVDYGQFAGEDGYSFDSPVFIRYLGWRKALPTYAELKELSPAVGLYPDYLARDYYMDGSVALRYVTAGHTGELLSLSEMFGDETAAVPGFPVREGSGTVVEVDHVFAIPPNAPDPDAAWAFIRSFLLASDLADGDRWNPNGMTAYLPALEKECDSYLSKKRTIDPNGATGEWGPEWTDGDIRGWMDLAFPGQPFLLTRYCTEKDAKLALDLVKNAGRPFREQLPAEAQAIVNEEVAAFLGGVGSADDCAGKIQSRVSIWLAENR